ncbi:MAG: hypothetical protein ACPGJS_06795 [Flammeovirgaceae bacterium]
MKLSFKSLGFLMAFVLLSTTMVMAGGATEKLLLKAKTAISKASADDWYVRASWAKKCIAKGVNTKEVGQWIDKSLEIQENAYTLEVKGDYYAKNRMTDKAITYYIKSIQSNVKGDASYDPQAVQAKVLVLRGK